MSRSVATFGVLLGFVAAAGLAGSRLAVSASVASDHQRYAVRKESTSQRTLRFTGGGARTFEVRAINGSIHVIGTDGDAVQVQMRRRVRAASDADVLAAEQAVRVEFLEDGAHLGAIVRDTGSGSCGESSNRDGWRQGYDVSVDFTVRVPKGTRLLVCGVNDGEVRIDRTVGDFNVSHVNGRIVMDAVRGSGNVQTVNGEIAASFVEPMRSKSSFKTVNGRITLHFPDDLSAELRMQTMNGGLYTDFDAVSQAVPPRIERRGRVSVFRIDRMASLRVGNGGPEISIQTLNGDVRVMHASTR